MAAMSITPSLPRLFKTPIKETPMRKPTEVPASLQNIDLKAVLRKRGLYFKQKVNAETKAKLVPIAKELLKKKGKKAEQQRYVHFTNEEAMEYVEKQVHLIHVVQEKFNLRVEQFIMKIVSGFLRHLESEVATQKKVKKFKAKDYFSENEESYQAVAQLDFTPLLTDQAVLAGQEALRLIKSKDVYLPDQYRKVIAKNVAKFTKSMLDTDRNKLIDIIDRGVTEGWNMGEIRDAITLDFADLSKMQAERITQTEVSRTSNQAALDAWTQSGVVEGKQWVTYGPAEDAECQHDGEVVADLGGDFYSIENEFQDGDPPVHPNCMCELLPVLINQSELGYKPDVKPLYERIRELEATVDKRTKAYKEIKELRADDQVYINALEKLTDE